MLAAYREKEQQAAERWAIQRKKAKKAAKAASDDSAPEPSVAEKPFSPDEWIPRFESVDGVSDEELSSIHGRLIAHGFLKFKLLGRTDGLGYQLTRLGMQGAMSRDERAAVSDEASEVEAA